MCQKRDMENDINIISYQNQIKKNNYTYHSIDGYNASNSKNCP